MLYRIFPFFLDKRFDPHTYEIVYFFFQKWNSRSDNFAIFRFRSLFLITLIDYSNAKNRHREQNFLHSSHVDILWMYIKWSACRMVPCFTLAWISFTSEYYRSLINYNNSFLEVRCKLHFVLLGKTSILSLDGKCIKSVCGVK